MKINLIISVLICFFCSTCLGQEYNLKRQTIAEDEKSITYENYLVLKSYPPIYLAPTRKLKKPERYDVGLNAKSIKLKYMQDRKFASISWDSFGHGSGRYINSGFLLVEFLPNDVIVLFRDIIQTHVRTGWAFSSYKNIRFNIDQNNVTIVLEDKVFNGDTKKHLGYIYRGKFDSGEDIYVCSFTSIEKWVYRMENHHLIFKEGRVTLNLDGSYPINSFRDMGYDIISKDQYITGNVSTKNYLGPYKLHNYSPYGGE